MPMVADSLSMSPFIATGYTRRSPVPDRAGKVGSPVRYLDAIVVHMTQLTAEQSFELGGAIPTNRFRMVSLNGVLDVQVDDYVEIPEGVYAGSYRVRGVAQQGSDHLNISAEKIVGT